MESETSKNFSPKKLPIGKPVTPKKPVFVPPKPVTPKNLATLPPKPVTPKNLATLPPKPVTPKKSFVNLPPKPSTPKTELDAYTKFQKFVLRSRNFIPITPNRSNMVTPPPPPPPLKSSMKSSFSSSKKMGATKPKKTVRFARPPDKEPYVFIPMKSILKKTVPKEKIKKSTLNVDPSKQTRRPVTPMVRKRVITFAKKLAKIRHIQEIVPMKMKKNKKNPKPAKGKRVRRDPLPDEPEKFRSLREARKDPFANISKNDFEWSVSFHPNEGTNYIPLPVFESYLDEIYDMKFIFEYYKMHEMVKYLVYNENTRMRNVEFKKDQIYIKGFDNILAFMPQIYPKCVTFFGNTAKDRARVRQWITFIVRNIRWKSKLAPEIYSELDRHLETLFFFGARYYTVADTLMYISLYPFYKGLPRETRKKYERLSHWFRFVQRDNRIVRANKRLMIRNFEDIPIDKLPFTSLQAKPALLRRPFFINPVLEYYRSLFK